MEDQALLDMLNAGVEGMIPFVARTGFEIVDAGRGHCTARLPLEPNVNHVGFMYAGALYTLAEVPGGVVAMTTFDPASTYPLVKEMTIRFSKPARSAISVSVSLSEDEIERVEREVAERGKSDWSWTCELTNEDGEVVCVTENQYQLRSR